MEKGEDWIKKFVLRMIKEGDTVIEVGANLGGSTLGIARKIGPKGRLIAFEPNPFSSTILTLRVRELPWVSIKNLMVCEKVGKRSFFISSPFDIGGSAKQNKEVKMGVETTTIDLVVSRLKLDCVNCIIIDCEGMEVEVIRGSIETLCSFPDLHIFVEIHMQHVSVAQIESLLSPLGYNIQLLPIGNGTWNVAYFHREATSVFEPIWPALEITEGLIHPVRNIAHESK